MDAFIRLNNNMAVFVSGIINYLDKVINTDRSPSMFV